MKTCPFCGKEVDLSDPDTLYPDGIGWLFDEKLGFKTYHNFRDVPKTNWCYQLMCGCGAEMHGDTRQEVIDKWNRRNS